MTWWAAFGPRALCLTPVQYIHKMHEKTIKIQTALISAMKEKDTHYGINDPEWCKVRCPESDRIITQVCTSSTLIYPKTSALIDLKQSWKVNVGLDFVRRPEKPDRMGKKENGTGLMTSLFITELLWISRLVLLCTRVLFHMYRRNNIIFRLSYKPGFKSGFVKPNSLFLYLLDFGFFRFSGSTPPRSQAMNY